MRRDGNQSHGLVIVLSLALAAAGCGGGGPFSYVKASGKVTFEDGTPLTVGRVVFQPLAPPKGEAYPRAGAADLDSEGKFSSVTSYKPGDGLVPGKHKVAIMFATDADGNSLVAEDYVNVSTSPITVDTADSPFDIVVKRP